MPWPVQHRLSKMISDSNVKGINRHSASHQQRVFQQALVLAAQERQDQMYPLRPRSKEEIRRPGAKPARGVRYPDESHLAVAVCNAYLHLYSKRSLVRVYNFWHNQEAKFGRYEDAFTIDTLKSWSRRYQWQARALLFDAGQGSPTAELIRDCLQMQQQVEQFMATPEGKAKMRENQTTPREAQVSEAQTSKKTESRRLPIEFLNPGMGNFSDIEIAQEIMRRRGK